MQNFRFMISQISWSIHYEGFAATLLKLVLKFFQALHIPVPGLTSMKNWIDSRFDSRFHVDTSGEVAVENLDISSDEKDEAVEYTSTPATFGFVLSKMELDYSQYVFIDYGCGKGKVLFMASDFPFHKIMGVEISAMLCESANRNIETFRSSSRKCDQFEVQCSDAKSFQLPEEPLILYFYNPFSETIMQEVLDSVQASLEKIPRSIYLVYYNPRHQDLMERLEQFKRVELKDWNDPMWAIYQTTDQAN